MLASLPPSVERTFPELKNLLEERGPARVTISKRTLRALLDLYLGSLPFDEAWYTQTYPDVTEGIRQGKFRSGKQHFLEFGYIEGRLPSAPELDAEWYARTYPDVAHGIASGKLRNAMEHFVYFGYREGRHPTDFTKSSSSFDGSGELTAVKESAPLMPPADPRSAQQSAAQQ
jgi:hypothetical protein